MGDAHAGSLSRLSPFAVLGSLRERCVGAALAQAGLNHAGLNEYLRAHLGAADPTLGALVTEPVIEGAPGYRLATETLSDLRGTLLRPETVDALTRSAGAESRRFDPPDPPYHHQLEAWRHLLAPGARSVLVTSGTGSGKTECFLVPLLDDLVRESEETGHRLSGVRAIMLYPLNALIASQEERLAHWTAPFKGRVRFGLYNGMTPEDLREHERSVAMARHPEQVLDRKTLRNDPPPILVTNVTMLEYLTIRRDDRPLIEHSYGKLRWIIIDEAHSYAGSAAAEIALLLRRVLQSFGVKPADVRFVATSATIRSDDKQSRVAIRRYLADLAGVDELKVHVIEGVRATSDLPAPTMSGAIDDPGDSMALARNPHIQAFVRAAEERPLPLADACRLLAPTSGDPLSVIETIADERGRGPILPLRVHFFMRAIPGLWSCLNPACPGGKPNGWPFGALAYEAQDHCSHCKSPLFEVSACRDCGEPYLEAFDHGGKLLPLATPPDTDEFSAASEQESETEGDDGAGQASGPPNMRFGAGQRRLIATKSFAGMSTVAIDPATGTLPDRRDAGMPIAITKLPWDGACPACRAAPRGGDEGPIRSFRFGAPFLVGNAAAVLLEGVSPVDHPEALLPGDGRQLLSFTDSRQGTARFAANIETNAERAYVRGYLYHLVQKSGPGSPDRAAALAKLLRETEALEQVAKSNPTLQSMAGEKRAAYDLAVSGVAAGVPWEEAHRALSQDPMIQHWIRAVWEDRDPRFRSDPSAFANFLLLRELARRPRRANALETLGLARLRFERIDNLSATFLPEPLQRYNRTIEEWRDLLYLLIDMPVRSYFALNVFHDDVHWLLPRRGIRRNLVGPNEDKRSKSDLSWPQARPGGVNPTPVLWLEHSLVLDHESPADRAAINEILDAAWNALRPLFEGAGPEYALDLRKAVIAPVTDAWICPVTRRVLSHRLFGGTPYGHREGSPFVERGPESLHFPALPLCFPQTGADRATLTDWLRTDPLVSALRARGAWRDLHDRAALLAPYLRAEEHSAQQPPERLRSFESEFRRGEINMLACSTTMEMGVDIGSVSTVLMTNVPPSIANYRQRVGRAGRRRQGFASALTLARDTPLDRETFRQPEAYLCRRLRPPQVTLDSPRIVQRHINALLLSNWFAVAKGELLKMKSGAFFGYSDNPNADPPALSPVKDFCAWLAMPSVRAGVTEPLETLVRGTALAGDPRLCTSAAVMFENAREAFGRQWDALRSESQLAPSDQARKSLLLQLKRLCGENLLKELVNRALLPAHGFPTAVIPFINDTRETRQRTNHNHGEGVEGAAMRRYDYPSRNADIALREYAPGAEVVIDGLVWRSAGVTLNWQRPAHEEAVREIQSLRHFWQCHECGAADCSRLRAERCVVCHSPAVDDRRFLEPAGFRVDWDAPCHANTDEVTFIEPEPVRVSARGADWEPLLDPVLGRGRASAGGLVFFASSGTGHRGYRICLECGRAEEEPEDGRNPLAEHTPLRGARPGSGRLCPGGSRAFAVTEPIALGYEVQTDVAEIQPGDLPESGGAWALVSALREALARRLGIEFGELGMAVESRRGVLAQDTHSLFLFDRNTGGAGFAGRVFDDLPALLDSARTILSCTAPGCERGCSACILTADLFAQQRVVDRKLALAAVERLVDGMRVPQAKDAAVPHAQLSPPAADAIARRMAPADRVTLFASEPFDVAALSDEPFISLFATARARGAKLRLALRHPTISDFNAAQRLGLRDAALRSDLTLWFAEPPVAANGAALIAMRESKDGTSAWFTRDGQAAAISGTWGIGQNAPVVYGTMNSEVRLEPIDPQLLLPKTASTVRVIREGKGRSLRIFGDWFAKLVRELLEPLGLWHAGALLAIRYSDRYLRSPLSVAVTLRALAGLRDALVGKGAQLPLKIESSPLDSRKTHTPSLLFHDWQRASDREAVIARLCGAFAFDPEIDLSGTQHARELEIEYRGGQVVRLYLDQGFGYWQIAGRELFDFAASPARQAKRLEDAAPVVAGSGATYIAVAGAG